MSMTEYEVIIKDVNGEELFKKTVKHSSLAAYVVLGINLFQLRKNEKYPTFCSIERHLLG